MTDIYWFPYFAFINNSRELLFVIHHLVLCKRLKNLTHIIPQEILTKRINTERNSYQHILRIFLASRFLEDTLSQRLYAKFPSQNPSLKHPIRIEGIIYHNFGSTGVWKCIIFLISSVFFFICLFLLTFPRLKELRTHSRYFLQSRTFRSYIFCLTEILYFHLFRFKLPLETKTGTNRRGKKVHELKKCLILFCEVRSKQEFFFLKI